MIKYKNRKNTNCKKWDSLEKNFGSDDLIPLWMADMDFASPPEIINPLQEYLEYEIYGYYKVPSSYWESIIQWECRYGYVIKKDWLRYSPSVIISINWLIQCLTKENDSVLIFPPSYKQFNYAILNNKRRLITVPLLNKGGIYSFDYDLIEDTLKKENVKMMIFSSPCNPVGRVWDRTELKKIMDLCMKYEVYVISDEIYQDISFIKHTPTATVGDYSKILITLVSASKGFNVAGLRNSNVIIENKEIMILFDMHRKSMHMKKGNPLGYIATENAYNNAKDWLEEVKNIIYENYLYLNTYFKKNLPDVIISPLQGTYLCWLDFSGIKTITDIKDFMINKCKVAVEFGWDYGNDNSMFIRVNLATDISNIKTFAERVTENLLGNGNVYE